MVELEGPGGPGAVVVDGLAPGRAHTAEVRSSGKPPVTVAFRTLEALAGPERCRIATISDMHLPTRVFGHRRSITEHPPAIEAASVRCARAALHDAVAWGAELIVVKGDVTDTGKRFQWRIMADLLAEVAVPSVLLPGNHDVSAKRTVEPWQAAAELGLRLVSDVESIDLPGVRVVLASTAVPGRSRGRLEPRREAMVEAVVGSPAALVALHHHLDLLPDPPFWPPGIRRDEADRVLDELAAAQPRTLVTSGHTHRHRRRQHGPVTVTQVGSTKDFPGVFGGYAVHDGGIRQVVRRLADPDCMRWTDTTRRAAGGLWGRMAQGRLDARCFTVRWD